MKGTKTAHRVGRAVAEPASVLLRVILWFAGITAVFVAAGVAYLFVAKNRSQFDVRAIAGWFQHLSSVQWLGLGVGAAVAVLLIGLPSMTIRPPGTPDKPASVSLRIIKKLAVIAVLLLYGIGVKAAYDVSRALGHSRDWAIIHGVYSWVYVGFSFFNWMGDHRHQPIWKSVRQFLTMV